jgi:hypothetical protein
VIFHLGLPLLKIGFGFLVIFIGLRFIASGRWGGGSARGWSGPVDPGATYAPDGSGPQRLEYNVMFGRGSIDLTKLGTDRLREVEINVVCGEAVVRVDPQTPIEVEANSAFGTARLPNGSVAFGQLRYDPRYPDGRAANLRVKLTVVGGSCNVLESGLV